MFDEQHVPKLEKCVVQSRPKVLHIFQIMIL